VGGFIVFDDGRAYAPNNRFFDVSVEAINDNLLNTKEGKLFSEWIMNQRHSIVGLGMGHIDIRELSPSYQTLLKITIRKAYQDILKRNDWK